MPANNRNTEGITRVSQQSLIQLRHRAVNLPLDSGKIHARQGGAYLSSFKGRGMEFDESRIYLPGDDIRSMDWKVTARTGQAHTKVFKEEHERPVLIWLDLNPSMFFATRGAFKSVIATKAATLLAWSTAANNDRLGALIFSGNDHSELRPKRGKSAVLDFIKHTCKHSAWQNNRAQNKPRNMALAMARLRKVTRPGSLLFLISDFREMDDQAKSHLINMARNNDIVLIHVFDPVEKTLPASGQYKVSDGTSELTLNTTNEKLRNEYQQRFVRHQDSLLRLCRQHRMHLLPVSTQEDTLTCLQNGLGVRASKKSQFRASK
jgi:uncharacterized protein (DUF58 family)